MKIKNLLIVSAMLACCSCTNTILENNKKNEQPIQKTNEVKEPSEQRDAQEQMDEYDDELISKTRRKNRDGAKDIIIFDESDYLNGKTQAKKKETNKEEINKDKETSDKDGK